MSKLWIKKLILLLIKNTKPLVWRLAEAYDIKVQRPGFAWGENAVIFEEGVGVLNKSIPKSTYFNTASGTITIGEKVVFGEDVKLLTGMHYSYEKSKKENVPLHYVPKRGRDIKIEKGVYVGSNAIIIGPVRIGKYSVIGAGAIVTKDIPEYALVYGNSAEVKKWQDIQDDETE
jgi:acetyltransferase-like isoleucine patch superfamily enzyme